MISTQETMKTANDEVIKDLSAETIEGIVKMLLGGETWLDIAIKYDVDSTQIGYIYKKLLL
jgi:hypothetical protein